MCCLVASMKAVSQRGAVLFGTHRASKIPIETSLVMSSHSMTNRVETVMDVDGAVMYRDVDNSSLCLPLYGFCWRLAVAFIT